MLPLANEPVVRLRTFGVILTMQCNFKCDHCINDSGPEHSDTINYDDALRIIKDIALESEHICFTGGESLLRKELLLKCISAAKDEGLKISMVTNGYWAKDETSTRNTLNALSDAGLGGICISFDSFHSSYVSKENAIRIATLSGEYDIGHIVRVCTYNNDSFCNELVDVFTENKIKYQLVKILRLGRAGNLPTDMFNIFHEQPIGSCSTVLSPILFPSGLVQACCGPGIHFREGNPLNVGNWKERPLQEIIRNIKMNPFVIALHNYGPKGIIELANKYEIFPGIGPRDFTGICDLCIELCNNPEFVDSINKIFLMEAERVKLIAGQVLQQSYWDAHKHGYLELPQ